MAELRKNPFTGDWIMIASHRQNRPQMPKDWCPFCPGSGKVPDEFDVLKYDNDFPALSQNPPTPDDVANGFFETAPAYGKCEVVLYSSGHTTKVRDLSDDHMKKLVDLWTERYTDISSDEKIKYVFIFENRGEPVGVTMPHPHGQIYGYSFLPKKIELEMENIKKYKAETGKNLHAEFLAQELKEDKRIIFKNEHFTVFLPFYSAYPYGVQIFANNHKTNLNDFNEEEKYCLGVTVKQTIGMLDSLFDNDFPYMMCMNNAPVNYDGDASDYRFHIEFYPPMRSADKIKFNASSETGVWAHCNPTCPEVTAAEMKDAYKKFMAK